MERETDSLAPGFVWNFAIGTASKCTTQSLYERQWSRAQRGEKKDYFELMRRVASCCLPEGRLVLVHGFRALKRNRRCNTEVSSDSSLGPLLAGIRSLLVERLRPLLVERLYFMVTACLY